MMRPIHHFIRVFTHLSVDTIRPFMSLVSPSVPHHHRPPDRPIQAPTFCYLAVSSISLANTSHLNYQLECVHQHVQCLLLYIHIIPTKLDTRSILSDGIPTFKMSSSSSLSLHHLNNESPWNFCPSSESSIINARSIICRRGQTPPSNKLSLNVMNFGTVQDSLEKAFSSGEPFSV